jgi:hypothetical protein
VVNVIVANGSGPTGRLLKELLVERGVQVGATNPDATISYGVQSNTTRPALNANAGRYNKLSQFEVMSGGGVLVPPFYRPQAVPATAHFPLFGRKLQHREGKDILVALQPEDVALRTAAGAQFFTEYVPRETEYRIWVYRRRHLRTYQKVMRHPEQYRFFGCSYRNGFAFELVNSDLVPRGAVNMAYVAVDALGLDFGAVDVLQAKDGRFFVLEVNTAPGVEGRRECITALADKMANWVRRGFPRRNGDTEAAEAAEAARPAARPVFARARAEQARYPIYGGLPRRIR